MTIAIRSTRAGCRCHGKPAGMAGLGIGTGYSPVDPYGTSTIANAPFPTQASSSDGFSITGFLNSAGQILGSTGQIIRATNGAGATPAANPLGPPQPLAPTTQQSAFGSVLSGIGDIINAVRGNTRPNAQTPQVSVITAPIKAPVGSSTAFGIDSKTLIIGGTVLVGLAILIANRRR